MASQVVLAVNNLILYDFPGSTVVKNPPANAGDARDAGLIPRLERSPGEGNGDPLQYSCPENPMQVSKESYLTEQLNNSVCIQNILICALYINVYIYTHTYVYKTLYAYYIYYII